MLSATTTSSFRWARTLVLTAILLAIPVGCQEAETPYGAEAPLHYPGPMPQIWAVAPALNISGQRTVDPLLQADLLYEQLQQVQGLTIIPVNRVVEAYANLRIDQVQTPDQAALVCDLLGCDALVVPTVTAYDPYNPPKMGASLVLLRKPGSYTRPADVDPRDLARRSTPVERATEDVVQVVGMYDAANGSVRNRLMNYAEGRNDPQGPLGPREYLVSMDRFCGFVYHDLAVKLMWRPELGR